MQTAYSSFPVRESIGWSGIANFITTVRNAFFVLVCTVALEAVLLSAQGLPQATKDSSARASSIAPEEAAATLRTLWSNRDNINVKFFYGKRITLKSKLPAEAELPLQQFKIYYTVGRDTVEEPYHESYNGQFLPASVKKIRIGIDWIYPKTGERVTLFAREATPEQTPPEIVCANVSAEAGKASSAAAKPKGKKPVQPSNFPIIMRIKGSKLKVPKF